MNQHISWFVNSNVMLEQMIQGRSERWSGNAVNRGGGFPCQQDRFNSDDATEADSTSHFDAQSVPQRKAIILVPFDVTPASLETARLGLGIARQTQARFILCHAVHLNLSPYGPANPAWLKEGLVQEAVGHAQPIIDSARKLGVPASWVVEEGSPASVILRVAKKRNADLIVLAARQPTWLERLFGRRTAERIVREAECPVMVLQTKTA